MRIGYFIPGWPPDKIPNGIVATLGRLSEALEKLGHEVFFLTPQLADGASDPRVSLVKFDIGRGLLERLRWKLDPEQTFYRSITSAIRIQLLQFINDRKIEIFEMEESHGWVDKVAKDLPIPVVTRLHGPWFTYSGITYPQTPSTRDKKRIDREGLAIRSAFAVTAPSTAVLQSTRAFYGDITELRKVIPNPMPPSPPEARWNYDACDKSTVLFVGRFDDHKGGDIVLRAFSELLKVKPDLRLNFVGPDVGVGASNGRLIKFADFMRNEIPAQAAARVNYLGTKPLSEIDGLRRAAALTVVASRYETFGGVVIEAMAIGAPLVATSVGGIREIAEDGRNALLVGPGNPIALASACHFLIDNPGMASRLAEQARIDCSNRYRPEEIAKQTVGFYTQVIAEFSRPGPGN